MPASYYDGDPTVHRRRMLARPRRTRNADFCLGFLPPDLFRRALRSGEAEEAWPRPRASLLWRTAGSAAAGSSKSALAAAFAAAFWFILATSSARFSFFFSMPSPRTKRAESADLDVLAGLVAPARPEGLRSVCLVGSLTQPCSIKQISENHLLILPSTILSAIFSGLPRLDDLRLEDFTFFGDSRLLGPLHGERRSATAAATCMRDFLDEVLKVIAAGHEVGLAVDFNHHANLATAVNVAAYRCLRRPRDRPSCRPSARPFLLAATPWPSSSSPLFSCRAFLQSIMPAPLFSRRAFTI